MLKKLLKYDLKFIFKLWWIAAAVCFSLSIAGGFCIELLSSSIERNLPEIISVSAGFMIGLTCASYVAFLVLSVVLIFVRFYGNFFSDEGYLTFTLPVKLSSLINSKLIAATLTYLCSLFAVTFCLVSMLAIGFWDDIFNPDFIKFLKDVVEAYFATNLICRIIYIIEYFILSVLCMVFGILFLFICITFASTVAKKARVILSIGIYFSCNSLFSFIVQLFSLFGIESIVGYFENLPANRLEPTVCLAGFCLILLLSMACMALYTFQYRLLERKLNLA